MAKFLVGHNIAADLPKLWKTGFASRLARVRDTMFMAAFQGHKDLSLSSLVSQIYHKEISEFNESMLTGVFPSPSLQEHNCTDVIATAMLWDHFKKYTYPKSFFLDMRFIPVLASMVDRGFSIDEDAAKALMKNIRRKRNGISLPINPNSPTQICTYLGAPNAQESTLECMDSEDARLVVKYKKYDKQHTYIQKYLDAREGDGRIHAHYGSTITGRLTCSKPPLHGVEKTTKVRSIFKAPSGMKYIVIDFDAGEYHVGAVATGDAELIEWVQRQSPHAYVADKYGLTYAQGKMANFAALNLGSAQTLVQNVGMSLTQAEDFLRDYPLAKLARRVAVEGEMDEFTSSPLGRRRAYTKPTETMTMLVQGGLAEVGKVGVIKVWEGNHAYPVHNEHDEWIFEIEERYALETAREVKRLFEDNYFGVRATCVVVDNWGQALIKPGEPGCGEFV